MTATPVQRVLRPATNGHAPRRPVRIEVDRHALVGSLMDLETLAREAITANGYAMQSVRRLLPGIIRHEALSGLVDTHERLVQLLNEARLAAGRFDGLPTT